MLLRYVENSMTSTNRDDQSRSFEREDQSSGGQNYDADFVVIARPCPVREATKMCVPGIRPDPRQ